MKNVCVFGDSISKGVIIDTVSRHYTTTKNCFINLLGADEPSLNLKNYSMFGCTISKGMSLLKRHKATVDDCDLVVLEYGGNDCDFDWASIAETPLEKHEPKTPIAQFTETYHEIIFSLREQGKKAVMLNLPPIDENKYFDWFGDGLNKENIKKWLGGDVHYIYEYHNGYNDAICDIAKQYDVPLIDIRSKFLSLPHYTDYLCFDGIHPNEEGHKLIASTIEADIPAIQKKLYPCESA